MTSTVANSARKIAQMIQFATVATSCHACEVASASMMRTGIRASVAPRTTGSSGVWTRPDSSCLHIPARFATRVVEPPETRLAELL